MDFTSSSPQISPAAASQTTVTVTLTNFVAEVIEASKRQLVLVDFWATWCGPCKQLGPIIEKVVASYNGTVRLAKIDIDRNQQIAQQMGVQSVPAVFAFFNGHPVDGFMGAVPETQLKMWVDRLIQVTGAKASEGAGVETESAMKQAAQFLANGDAAAAQAVYQDVLDIDPGNAVAYAGVVRCLIASGELNRARHVFDEAPETIAKDKAFAAIRAGLELAEQGHRSAGALAELEMRLKQNPNDLQTLFDMAMAYYALDEKEKAVDGLLEIVRRNRVWNEDAARKQLVKFFDALGPMDPLTIAGRKRLSSILFS